MSDEKGFEVRDKRKARLDTGPDSAGAEEARAGERPPEAGAPGQGEPPAPQSLDFISFAGSLGATALMYLGEMVSPEQPPGPADLAAAKQMIDLIDMLKEKTKGNLDGEESDMMDNLLYNLRVRYVRLAEKK